MVDVDVCIWSMFFSLQMRPYLFFGICLNNFDFKTCCAFPCCRSDGPLYELRREVVSAVVSMAAKAPSFDESSNDMSSGDITSPDEDEDKGTKG